MNAKAATSHRNRDLTGQVALVTGGGEGIGRTISEHLALAGAAVGVLGRTRASLDATVRAIEDAGGSALPLEADVTDEKAVHRVIRFAERKLGPTDLLVNNAGRGAAIGPSWEIEPLNWWRDVEVNLRGVFLCCHAAMPGMVARHRGRIINVTSEQGFVASRYLSAYSSSKAGVMRLTDCLAAEAAPHGVRVFAISPGLVRTAMSEFVAHSPEGRKWRPEVAPVLAQWTQGPERAARLVVRLASGLADSLSGRFVGVNDDLDDLVKRADEIARDDLAVLRFRNPKSPGA